MADRIFQPDRRMFMAGMGATLLGPARLAAAPAGRPLGLQASTETIRLRSDGAAASTWALNRPTPDREFRFKRGETLEIDLLNKLPVRTVLNWHGIGGTPAVEPLLAHSPLEPDRRDTFMLPLPYAGTFLCDLRLLADGQTQPVRAKALIVGESEAIAVDRDETLVIEDWRLRADGTAIAPGVDPKETTVVYTINGARSLDISARIHERLRLRFINGCQRAVIALKIENHEVRVMAMDGQPCEPFPARSGALVLAPGSRVDVFIDATAAAAPGSAILLHDGKDARPLARLITSSEPPARGAPLPPSPPLPSNGLPPELDLKNALRADLVLGGSQGDWVPPATFAASSRPAFSAKTGRAMVVALIHRGDRPAVFHLHGHHFRLLDRLDDGWKPFWLDTLAVEPGQTQRIAFAAEHPGRWLMESMTADWSAPRLLRWYSVG